MVGTGDMLAFKGLSDIGFENGEKRKRHFYTAKVEQEYPNR